MNLRFLRHPRVGLITILLLLLIPTRDLFARRRGRTRPPLGSALFEMWSFADPWGALNGWGVPQHNVDAPRRGGGSSPGGWINYGSSGGTQSRSIDRSRAFPGGSSNISTTLPSISRSIPNSPFRTERRFDPPYFTNYNSYWYHGYWGGGKWGWGRWGGSAGIASFPRWSSGPFYYVSGYGQFRNPFVTGRVEQPYLDYSRPIEDLEDDEQSANSTTTAAGGTAAMDPAEETAEDRLRYLMRTPEVKAGLKAFDVADEAFKQKNYELALEKADEALEQLPDDTALHEFRALVFARGDYQQAAAAIYAVLVVSPGWDWTTLGSRYTDQDEFPRQLRALEAHHREHPQLAAAAFLRGYHYTSCRHFEAAVKQFQKTVQLIPEDELLPGLVALISGAIERSPSEESSDEPAVASTQSTEQQPEPDFQPIAKTQLVGNWKALRGETTSIQLTVRDDDQLVWTATHEGNPRRIVGRYALVGNILFLGTGSGALIGHIELKKQGGFMITIPDVSPANKGLEFARDGER